MSSIISVSIDTTKIKRDQLAKGRYLQLTVSVNDQLDNYENNCAVFVSQTKEERDAKTPKNYLGNGKVVFTDGQIKTSKDLQPQLNTVPESDSPF
jgi:hypothetical protein